MYKIGLTERGLLKVLFLGVFGILAFYAIRCQIDRQRDSSTISRDLAVWHEKKPTNVPRDPPVDRPLHRPIPATEARELAGEEAGRFLGTGFVSSIFDDLTITEAQGLFHGQMMSNQYSCQKMERFGRQMDGGYEICLDEPYSPAKNNCLVYSFGISKDWSFDDAVNANLGCEVHSFDPSINLEDHVHKPGMYFHNLGIWGSNFVNDMGWKLSNLTTIIRDLNHEKRTIDFLKIDVEGAEFSTLRDMIDSGVVRQVKQLALEPHSPRLVSDMQPMSLIDYAEIYHTFNELESLGFRKFLTHTRNNCCKRFQEFVKEDVFSKTLCCYEVFYVNDKFSPPTEFPVGKDD